MSKIGRKPIDIGSAKVEVKGQDIHYSGKMGSGVHTLPDIVSAKLDGNKLFLTLEKTARSSDSNMVWGLNRAIVANKILGSQKEFEKVLQINGLGFKAAVSGKKVVFSLGFSHKIDFNLPQQVSLEVDKTGQRLVFRSADKELVGQVCSEVRSLRPPEPYKGTGIKLETEVIARKAGKTKAA